MIINDIIRSVDLLRPGSSMAIEEYLRCINDVEEGIYSNIISAFEGDTEFRVHTAVSEEVQVPDMYAQLYKHYILAQIDLANGDIARYSNNMILYNNLLTSYWDWYIRNHMPKQKGRVSWL